MVLNYVVCLLITVVTLIYCFAMVRYHTNSLLA